ncbi:MAG: DUF1257 domain-containing protein [Lacipirellulaceae bacterium]
MSHIVTISTQVRDPIAIEAACSRLKLSPPNQGTHRLFNDSIAGLAVLLPDWKYPVVCQTGTGQLRYDNFNGRWGDPARLDQFLQSYAVEKAKLTARRQGHAVAEASLPDGSIRLNVAVGGDL